MGATRRLGDSRYGYMTKWGEFTIVRGPREYVRGTKGHRGRHVNFWWIEDAPAACPAKFKAQGLSPLKADCKRDMLSLITREMQELHGSFARPTPPSPPTLDRIKLERMEKLERQLSDALRMNEMQAKLMESMQAFIDQQARLLCQQALAEAD